MKNGKANKKIKRSAKYDESYIQKLKANILIEDVIKKDVNLEKIGKNLFGKCPFCGGKKSFCVSLDKQFAHCFQCNISMDVIGYLMKVKGLSFLDSIIELKRYINVNNIASLKKIRRAYLCTGALKDGDNPYNIVSVELIEYLKKSEIREVMASIHGILGKMIEDYSILTMDIECLPEEINYYIGILNNLFYFMDRVNEKSAEKLKNLCTYLIYICDEIKLNNYNIGGLVLDLS